MSGTRPDGAAPTSSTSRSATSSTAIGCTEKAGARRTGSRRWTRKPVSTSEWNWVDRRTVTGTSPAWTTRSAASLAR